MKTYPALGESGQVSKLHSAQCRVYNRNTEIEVAFTQSCSSTRQQRQWPATITGTLGQCCSLATLSVFSWSSLLINLCMHKVEEICQYILVFALGSSHRGNLSGKGSVRNLVCSVLLQCTMYNIQGHTETNYVIDSIAAKQNYSNVANRFSSRCSNPG